MFSLLEINNSQILPKVISILVISFIHSLTPSALLFFLNEYESYFGTYSQTIFQHIDNMCKL